MSDVHPNVRNPDEIATVFVGGRRFDDWETVYVQHRWADPYPVFRFTATERDPIPELWAKLQFKPGDRVGIYLGGILAITGVILDRQVAYDANSHGVMLQGVGWTWYAARGSIIHKTGSFDNKTFEQVAREVIAPFGVGVKTIGNLNATPFERLQVETGENLWAFLERLARPRGIVMGSDHLGNILLIDDHNFPITDTLIEGFNILRCQATISIKDKRSDYIVRGQTAGGDKKHGPDASEQEGGVKGSLDRYSPLLTPAEQPVWGLGEIIDRAKNEAVWNEATEVQATITVQGWMRARRAFIGGGVTIPAGGVGGISAGLWRAGDKVTVNSPMAMLNNFEMKIQNATFTQDSNSGTLTTLDLVAPWLLKDQGDPRVGPQAPGQGKAGGPATTPEAALPPENFAETMAAHATEF